MLHQEMDLGLTNVHLRSFEGLNQLRTIYFWTMPGR